MRPDVSPGKLFCFLAIAGLVACGEIKTRIRPYLEIVDSQFTMSQGSVPLIAPKGNQKGRLGNWTLHIEGKMTDAQMLFKPFASQPTIRIFYTAATQAEGIEVLSATYQRDDGVPIAITISDTYDQYLASASPLNQSHRVNYVAPPGFDHNMTVSMPHVGYGEQWLAEQHNVVHRYHFDLIVNGEPASVGVGFKVFTEIVKYRPTGAPGMP